MFRGLRVCICMDVPMLLVEPGDLEQDLTWETEYFVVKPYYHIAPLHGICNRVLPVQR